MKSNCPGGFAETPRVSCPRPECLASSKDPESRRCIRHGCYYRASDSRWIERFGCPNCRRTFSRATGQAAFGQLKRRINEPLFALLNSRVSQRRSALILGINRKTVARRLRWFALQAPAELESQRLRLVELQGPVLRTQFDELETFEHTRLKPVAVPVLVESRSRVILGIDAASMPAKGKQAMRARQKYGKRPNQRSRTIRSVWVQALPGLAFEFTVSLDQCPLYPSAVDQACRSVHPRRVATLKRYPGRRPRDFGHGELKQGGYDPLFSINHTCAMLRYTVSRLVKKTWCTTKKLECLRQHLLIAAVWHNRQILARLEKQGPTPGGTS